MCSINAGTKSVDVFLTNKQYGQDYDLAINDPASGSNLQGLNYVKKFVLGDWIQAGTYGMCSGLNLFGLIMA